MSNLKKKKIGVGGADSKGKQVWETLGWGELNDHSLQGFSEPLICQCALRLREEEMNRQDFPRM